MTKQVVLTGSVAFDYIMRFPGNFTEHILPDQLERLSLSFLVDDMRKEKGGIAANIGYTMGLLGANPLLVATAGQDFGDYRAWLEQNHVDTSGVKVIDGKFTASFFVNTDEGNRQIATFYAGAMGDSAELSLTEIDREKTEFVVVSPASPDGMVKMVRQSKELGIPYVYDPSQQTVRLSAEDLREGIDGSLMLIVNDYELSLIEKRTGWDSAVIARKVATLVITKGEHGATVITRDGVFDTAAALTDTVADPTGGGDAFRGGFFRAYTAGADWTTAAQIGSLAATYCLEQVGTQAHTYTIPDFIARYARYYGDTGKVETVLQA
jgi:adenosine kinase